MFYYMKIKIEILFYDKKWILYFFLQQKLRLNNERFAVPELLFTPLDIGINEMGIAEAVIDSVQACPEEARCHLYKNIVLTGGCALFPGFKERLYKDIRASAPDEYEVNITLPQK